ncbi:disease resistance protein RPV1-like [Eucalyptus grandis]|uniref:disease resistance protein RPV1-like n=1 Tax=Eucalyptus grandis TaxID=71139 RepID=UPI00192E7D2E|nr:disease resistance protein RPV1-like [Eucalyptus grandis]XP_039165011.1 disease resistance protein RPV1-like [Eucalyptus grandis]XP_039165012.1 disease resistance protein RPV1-like [Eucalyptus grandis]XP_039165013.1 disease resistance protein RPV1-like [Eucalyptus grandis]XP_039165014.1 disease resistance protein RPV1-like [Eucalyptus grandis]XP_039165015.1 disease resistance protein RPV1-like [Eucalyptus grandis]XP_039165016.1 disease resistance protein RPV1-like [Eucalyptus grandis]XP_0
MSILDKANADPKYKLNELTRYQALTLFSRHLFGKDSPPEAYKSLSWDVVSGIKRIPLIVEHIGSAFRQKREELWKDTFKKLKDDVYNNNLQDLLHITYESLDHEQQQIFLDIACFFIGSSKQIPTYMWDSCGFLPKRGIEALIDSSLIGIDKDDKLIMDDQSRDFGRKIVYLEHQEEFQLHSRLWIYEQALHVLDNNKTATNVKVLNLSSCPFSRTLDLFAFKSLEILILENCENLEEIHPSIEDSKSLVSLNIGGCRRLEKLPIGVGRLEELKELLINDTAIQEIPMSGDGLMKLETLNASCCGRLEELPAGVGRMEKLRELVINDTAIREIPMSKWGLKELHTLNVSGCRSLEELPIGVEGLEKLRELLINDTAIRKIPIGRHGFRELKTMCASYCEELAQLPIPSRSLWLLTKLDLSHSGIEEFPEGIVNLRSLTQLDLSYSWVEKLPRSFKSLVYLSQLNLSHSGIREFPNFEGYMKWLTHLDLSHTGIEELPKSMNSLKEVTHLNLSYLGIKRLPQSMEDLVSLQHLLLRGCYLLRHLLDSIERLTSLTKLDLQSTRIVELPPEMRNMKNLKILGHSWN